MSGKQQGGAFDIAMGVLMAKALGKAGTGTRRLMFRWRRALLPLWVGFVVYLGAVLLRWLAPEWTAAPLLLPIIGIGLALMGPWLGERWTKVVMSLVPSGLDRGGPGVLDRPVERIYFGTLTTYMGIYMTIRAGLGPSEFSGWMWKIGVLIWGGIWWWHRRIRTVGRADKFAKHWPKFADKDRCPFTLSPLIGSKVVRAQSHGRGAKLTVALAQARTAAGMSQVADNLAAYFHMRIGSVFVSSVEEDAGYVVFTFLPKDPWKGAIPHPLPTPGSITLAGKGKQFAMGVLAHGVELVYDLQHTLVVGQTGSGKSIWLHSLMAWLVACRDCVVIGIDMAGGATLRVWNRALALPLATDMESAVVVLERVLGVVVDRENQLGQASEDDEEADDSFEPSEDTPWLVLVIDEFPDLISEANKTVIVLLSRIAKRARKCGVRLIFASQNGTKVDLGSKELQAQLNAIVGLQLSQDQSRNLWGTHERQGGWSSAGLRKGQFLLKDDAHTRPEIAKGFMLEQRDRVRQAKAAEALCKQLEPTAWAILRGTKGSSAIDVDFEEMERVELPVGNPVFDFLVQHGPATVAEMEGKIEPSRATIYRKLGELGKEGLGLVTEENAVYRVADDVVPLVTVPRQTESEPGTKPMSIQGEQVG